MRILVIVLALLSTGMSLDRGENRLMFDAYTAGQEDGTSYALMGILAQETYFGRYGPVGDTHLPVGYRAYGPFQIRVGAARAAIKICPELDRGFQWEEEIISYLLTSDQWGVSIASCYLSHHLERMGSIRAAIARYNGSQVEDDYVGFVESHARSIKNHFNLPTEGDLLFDVTRVLVKPGDSLYQIITEHYPEKTHTQIVEKMQQVVENNPQAFINNNPDQMKANMEIEL